jgi:hypothetical protein
MELKKIKEGATKKEIFSYTVSALANYTEEQKGALITKALFSAKTIDMLTPMIGVKTAQTVNRMDTDATFQAGGTCGWNASGTTEFSQRTLTVGQIKVQEALCPKELNAKYTQYALKAGSLQDALPFEDMYAELKAGIIAEQMETAVWQGDTTSGTANLNKFDGLLKVLGKTYSSTGMVNVNAIAGTGTVSTAVGTATVTGVGTSFTSLGIAVGDKLKVGSTTGIVQSVDSATQITLTANFGVLNSGQAWTWIPTTSSNFTTPYTSITVSNVIAIMQSVYNSIPVQILDRSDLKIFVGNDVYRLYITALINANLFAYAPTGPNATSGEIVLHGTNIPIVSVNGLNTTNRIIASVLSNMFFGTDLMHEEEQFRIWYSQDNDEIRYMSEWKAGVQVGFLNQVVQYTNA